jgi:3-oxoacyl-[acyl-carrier protein] reductase
MSQDVQGKVALVTGSGRGLGRAYAEHLARLGADVIVHDKTMEAPAEFGEAENLREVAESIEALGRRALVVTGDVAKPGEVRRFVAQALEAFGRIDILVNNAGGDIAAAAPRPDPNDGVFIKDEDVHAVIDRNLTGTIHLCRAVAPAMMARRSGQIVNVSSSAALTSVTTGIVYAAAKAGIIHYTRCLAQQLREYNVRVNCLSPGPTVTARFLATRDVSAEALRETEGLVRLGRPADQARAVEFLVVALSEFITGQNIVVDGGSTP